MNILITGGASGLGEAITKRLAAEHTVYFTYFRSGEKAAELEKQFPNAHGIQANFEDAGSLDALLAKIEELNIQVLINNALPALHTDYFHKTPAEHFAESFTKNILPVIKITQKAILHFRKQKSGKIITILSSYIINRPPTGLSEYVAEKNYLLSLSRSWAVENAKFGISSNCISPAMMQTALTAGTDERIIEEMTNNHPLKRLLNTDEVANAVHYLVQASPQTNGTNMIINAASDLA